MKIKLAILLAPALLLASHVSAQGSTVHGVWQGQLDTQELVRAEDQVDGTIEFIAYLSSVGHPAPYWLGALDVDVVAENGVYIGLPDQCHIPEMVRNECGDLGLRAWTYVLNEDDVRAAQFQVILGRYERIALWMEDAWAGGRVTDDLYWRAMGYLRSVAFDYIESLGVVSVRERLQEALAVMEERGLNAINRAAAAQDFYYKMYRLRLEASLAVLQERLNNGKATKLDFFRINEIVAALTNLKTGTHPFICP